MGLPPGLLCTSPQVEAAPRLQAVPVWELTQQSAKDCLGAGFQIPDPGGSFVEATLQSSLQDQHRLGLWLNTPRPSFPALPLKVLASRESTFFKNPVHAHASQGLLLQSATWVSQAPQESSRMGHEAQSRTVGAGGPEQWTAQVPTTLHFLERV